MFMVQKMLKLQLLIATDKSVSAENTIIYRD